jgi:hypothetical protein
VMKRWNKNLKLRRWLPNMAMRKTAAQKTAMRLTFKIFRSKFALPVVLCLQKFTLLGTVPSFIWKIQIMPFLPVKRVYFIMVRAFWAVGGFQSALDQTPVSARKQALDAVALLYSTCLIGECHTRPLSDFWPLVKNHPHPDGQREMKDSNGKSLKMKSIISSVQTQKFYPLVRIL